MPGRPYQDAAQRLADRSVPDGECLVYTRGHPQRSGHRMMTYRGRPTGVHRIAFELAHGSIPEGMVVMHTCDNPPCVRVDHLRLGTIADNNRDRDQKGRHIARRGSANSTAKLDERQVAEIKGRLGRGESTYALSQAYGISQTVVWKISTGQAWSHVKADADALPPQRPNLPDRVRVRLTPEQVVEMRVRYAAGEAKVADLAADYGASLAQVASIVRGDSWRHVGGPTKKSPAAERLGAPMVQLPAVQRAALDGIDWPDGIEPLERAA